MKTCTKTGIYDSSGVELLFACASFRALVMITHVCHSPSESIDFIMIETNTETASGPTQMEFGQDEGLDLVSNACTLTQPASSFLDRSRHIIYCVRAYTASGSTLSTLPANGRIGTSLQVCRGSSASRCLFCFLSSFHLSLLYVILLIHALSVNAFCITPRCIQFA